VLARFGLGLAVGGALILLAAFHGGYAPAAWGWGALLAFWVSILVLALGSKPVLDRAALALFAALLAVVGWTALSATWSASVPRTMLELERDLLYVAVVSAALLLSRWSRPVGLISGVTAGVVIVVTFALVRYLIAAPRFDETQGYLLFRPIGYANALGGLAALALPLVVAFAAHDSRERVKAVAGASAVVLAVALYLTQNRSGWLALGVALVIWLLRTSAPATAASSALVLAVPAGSAVAFVAALGLFDTRSQSADLGTRRLVAGAAVVVLALAAGVLAARMRPLRLQGRAVVRASQCGALLVLVAITAALFDLGDRAHYWRVAWRVFEKHPLIGSGAGTFDEQWFRYRDVSRTVHEAHSLYLEALSELGVVGLVMTVLLFAIPVVAARRARDPLLTAALGAYCGFLVHAGFEWDWEMPITTISGLLLACALVLSAAPGHPIRIGNPIRTVAGLATAALAVFVVITLAGNTYVVAAEHRVAAGDLNGAVARARRARRLLPWASEPWLVLGDVRSRSGDPAGAQVAFRQAISRDPSDWELWLRLAAASSGHARRVALSRANELDPRLRAVIAKAP
jgi:O-antigen ligase